MPCGYVYSTEAGARVQAVGVVTHILREASALSVLLYQAMRRPQQAERATSTALTLFCFINQS